VEHFAGEQFDVAVLGRALGAEAEDAAAAEEDDHLFVVVVVRGKFETFAEDDARDHHLVTDDAAAFDFGHGVIGGEIGPAVDGGLEGRHEGVRG